VSWTWHTSLQYIGGKCYVAPGYTIFPVARKELLRRLLVLNRARAAAESAAAPPARPRRGKKPPAPAREHVEMFSEGS